MTITALDALVPYRRHRRHRRCDILIAWSRWHERGVGVSPDLDTLAPHVRDLIVMGHSTPAAHSGLACWTITALSGRQEARMLPDLTQRYARDRSAKARKWRAEMRQHIGSFGAGDLRAVPGPPASPGGPAPRRVTLARAARRPL